MYVTHPICLYIESILIETFYCKDYIDSKGDAEGNYTLIALQEVEDERGVSWQMKSIGYFHYSNQSSVIPVWHLPQNMTFHIYRRFTFPGIHIQ